MTRDTYTSLVNQKAFNAAWEAMGWDNQNPQATDAQERFVAAYEHFRTEPILVSEGEAAVAGVTPGLYHELRNAGYYIMKGCPHD